VVEKREGTGVLRVGARASCTTTICGWGQHGDITRQLFTIVTLSHDHEHPQVAQRFDLSASGPRRRWAGIRRCGPKAMGRSRRRSTWCCSATSCRLHLAFDAGVDPGPEPILDEIKSALG